MISLDHYASNFCPCFHIPLPKQSRNLSTFAVWTRLGYQRVLTPTCFFTICFSWTGMKLPALDIHVLFPRIKISIFKIDLDSVRVNLKSLRNQNEFVHTRSTKISDNSLHADWNLFIESLTVFKGSFGDFSIIYRTLSSQIFAWFNSLPLAQKANQSNLQGLTQDKFQHIPNLKTQFCRCHTVHTIDSGQSADLKALKSFGTSCQIEIHFSIQTTKFLVKYK